MRRNPADYLRRERDITTALTSVGLDVVAPTTLVDPGPHAAGDLWFLLMSHRRLEPVDLTSNDQAIAVGRSLVELEAALAELPAAFSDTGQGHPWDQIATLLATVSSTADTRTVARMTSAVDMLRATEPDDRWRLVHGDAHRVNIALDGRQVLWFDFEDANRRPLAWDTATLRRAWPAAGDAACRLLDIDASGVSMAWHHELREIYALLWNLLYAQRYQRARPAATTRLDDWLARNDLDKPAPQGGR
jgi:Ser/Thr protein kinase RdoA (MazF antagonist)